MGQRPVIFVTGLSGAGMSTGLKALEDIGYEVFDNFPLSHVEPLLNEEGYKDNPVAFGLDSRTRGFNPRDVIKAMKTHAKQGNAVYLLFMGATNASLQKRFSETRRTHPLAKDRTVLDGIIHERNWLQPLIEEADRVIDTTDLSVHDLRRIIENDFNLDQDSKRLSVTVMSFGYKNGVPREVDMVLDARFLRNPHWNKELKPFTGQDKAVQDYIREDKGLEPFYVHVETLVEWLLPRYAHEGKSYFTVAFGCTGGKHRSVYLAERLAEKINDLGYPTVIRHRDMPV